MRRIVALHVPVDDGLESLYRVGDLPRFCRTAWCSKSEDSAADFRLPFGVEVLWAEQVRQPFHLLQRQSALGAKSTLEIAPGQVLDRCCGSHSSRRCA